jgi:hypothetical protein
MPGRGIDFVLPVDYNNLVVARQSELAYIAEQLAHIAKHPDDHDVVDDLRGWLNSRRTCFQPGK